MTETVDDTTTEEETVADAEGQEEETQEAPESEAKVDKEVLDKLVSEELKGIKGKLDKAFKERDEARKEAKKIQEEAKKAKIARLEEEGKELEALKLKNADLESQVSSLQEKADSIARDARLTQALSGLDFRNKKSQDMAFRDISSSLVRQDDGSWAIVDGTSIEDYVQSYSAHEDNSFLFKVKVSSGSGLPKSAGAGSESISNKSLFDLPQDQVLKMAAEGKLTRKK